jgi:hypothetical protein
MTGYFSWIFVNIYDVLLNSYIEECLWQKLWRTKTMVINFFPKTVPFVNVHKKGTARQTTGDKIIMCMQLACWITKATNAHSEYIILNCFSTTTVVEQMCLNVALYVPMSVFLKLAWK